MPALTLVNTTPSMPSILDNKLDRDNARSRQLIMKPADRQKSKQHRGCTFCKPMKWRGGIGNARNIQPGLARELKSSDNSTDEDEILGDFVECCRPVQSQEWVPPTPAREVDLADIAKPAKRRGGLASDFEFIPRLKPVVPLPDWEANSSDTSDDPADNEWEHIESINERKAKRKAERAAKRATYANVLTKNAKA